MSKMLKIYSTQFDDIFLEFDIEALCESFQKGLYGLDISEEFASILRTEMKAKEDRRREELNNVSSVEPEPRKRTTRRCLRRKGVTLGQPV